MENGLFGRWVAKNYQHLGLFVFFVGPFWDPKIHSLMFHPKSTISTFPPPKTSGETRKQYKTKVGGSFHGPKIIVYRNSQRSRVLVSNSRAVGEFVEEQSISHHTKGPNICLLAVARLIERHSKKTGITRCWTTQLKNIDQIGSLKNEVKLKMLESNK